MSDPRGPESVPFQPAQGIGATGDAHRSGRVDCAVFRRGKNARAHQRRALARAGVVGGGVDVLVGLVGTGTPWNIRGMVGWFGVRGIGSLYYLMYAIQHGLPKELAMQLIHLTLMVVTLSILVHGTSVKPLMERFWRPRRNAKDRS